MSSRRAKTRFALLGGGLVILAGGFTGLVAYYATGGQAAEGPAELRYVPSSATAVAFADVRGIMDSEVRKQLSERLPSREAQDSLRDELGIDVEQDIDRIVAGFVGNTPSADGAVVLLRGRFDRDRVEAAAIAHGAVVESYSSARLLLSPDGGWMTPDTGLSSGDDDGAAALPEGAGDRSSEGGLVFLEDGLLAVGGAAALRGALDAQASGQNVTTNVELMQLVSSLEGRHDAWVAGRLDALSAPELPSAVQAQLALVQSYALGATVDRTVSGEIRAEARSDEAAGELRDSVQGAVAAARLMAGGDERLVGLLGSLQVAGSGRTVSLAFAIPPEFFEALGGLAIPAPGEGTSDAR